MKRIIALLLCLVMVVCVIASCGEPEEVHSHTYSETWSSDAVGHWYQATCDCEDAPEQKFSHVDKNNDGACDVCEYKMACADGHTYAEGWTVDCTNHWNAADCGHIVAGANVAAHADANGDGECDVCKYVINDIHTHYFDTKWTGDSEYHWHAALCEHGVEVADKAAHVLNAAGYCTVCDAKIKDIDLTDLAAVLAAAVARNDKVAFGDVIASEAVYGGTGAQTLENGKTNKVHFALGNGESYVQYISFDMTGAFIGQNEQWFEDLGNGEVFGAEMESGEYELAPIAGAAQFLNGYNYTPGSVIASDSVDTSTLANMLSALYDQMNEGVRVKDATKGIKDGVYFFSYTYYSVNATTVGGELYTVELEYYNVDVEFTVNEDLIIDTANFQVEVYRDYENDSDLDYTYTDNGDGTVTISEYPTLKATANPSFYNYSVAQMSGERTFTTPYPRASLLPSSFELLYVLETEDDENGNDIPTVTAPIGESIDIVSGTYASFAIGDILPVTASSKFINSDDFTFEFVNNDPDSTGRAWYMDPGSVDETVNGYSAYTGVLKLKLRDAGSYTVTISFGDISKTFVLNVTAAPVTEITGDADSISVKVVDLNTYFNEDQTYFYTAAAEGNYTFTVPAGLGARLDGEETPAVDLYDNGGVFTVGLNAGESVKIYFAAGDTNKYEVTIAYEAADIPDNEGGDQPGGDDPISGAVTIDGIVGTYNVGTIGTLTINADGTAVYAYTQGGKDYTATYTFEIAGGEFKFLTINGNPFNNAMAAYFGILTFNAEGKPATFTHNGTEQTLTTGGSEGGDEPEQPGGDQPGGEQVGNVFQPTNPDGTFDVKVSDTYTWDDEYVFKAPVAGTYTFTLSAGLGVFSKAQMDNFGDAEVDFYSNETGAAFSVELSAGEMFVFYVGSLETGTYTVSFTDDEDKIVYPTVGLFTGDNEITVVPGQLTAGVNCKLDCWEPGEYTFTLAGATISVYNPLGELMATGNGSVTAKLESYRSYKIVVKPTAAGNVTLTVSVAYPEGTYQNPEAITVPTTLNVNLPGNYTTYYYKFTATATGKVTITFANTNITVTLADKEITSGSAVTVIAGTEYTLTAYADEAQTDTMTIAFEAGELTEADWFGLIAGDYLLIDGSNLTISADGTIVRSYMSFVTWENLFEYNYTGTLTVGDDGVITIATTPVGTGTPALGTITMKDGGGYYTVSIPGIYEGLYPGETDVEIEANDQDGANYSYIAEAAGTFVVTVNGFSYYDAATDAWVECPADALAMAFSRGTLVLSVNGLNVYSNTATVALAIADTVTVQIVSPTGQAINAKVTFAFTESTTGGDEGGSEGGDEGGMTGSGTTNDPYIVGAENLPIEIPVAGDHDLYYQFTATEAMVITVSYTSGNYVSITGGYWEKDSANFIYTVTLTAGETITINPWGNKTGTYVIAVAAPEGGDESDIAGSGTKNDPYVIPALPSELTLGKGHDVYVTYTATETQTIVITYPAGCYVSDLPGDAVKDSNAQTYTFTLTAGTTIKFNPWTMGSNEAYTYKFEIAAPTTPDEGGSEGGEGGEGGETTGVLTYISALTNGRYVKFEINVANGTMVVTRSNSSGSFDGVTGVNYTYSYDAATKTVTFTLVDAFSSFTGMEFDENGAPVSVAYYGVAYTGYTLQA